MNTKISADEWYPVFSLGSSYGNEIEVSDELFDKHQRIMKEFDELQAILHKIYRGLK